MEARTEYRIFSEDSPEDYEIASSKEEALLWANGWAWDMVNDECPGTVVIVEIVTKPVATLKVKPAKIKKKIY